MLFHSTVIENGLRIVVYQKPESLITSAGLFIRHGARNEKSEEIGISHFLEHMLFNNQRAIKRGKNSVKELINIGGILNAHTTKECTIFEGLVLEKNLKTLLEALYELTFEGDFTEEDVLIERNIILAELNRKLHSADQIMDFLVQGIYDNTGYGNLILGNQETISSFTREKLKQKYEEVYIADNAVLVIITNGDINDVFEMSKEIYSKVGSGVPTPTEIDLSESVHLKVLKQNTEHVALCIGGIGPSLRDEGGKNFEAAIKGFGGTPNSKLSLAARERDGLVYQIQSFYRGYIQTGNWGVFTTVSKSNFYKLLEVLFEEIKIIRENSLNVEEINNVISSLKTDLFMKINNQQYLLKMLGENEIFSESIYPNSIIRQFELVTVKRAHEYLKKYTSPLGISLVAMGNVKAEKILNCIELS